MLILTLYIKKLIQIKTKYGITFVNQKFSFRRIDTISKDLLILNFRNLREGQHRGLKDKILLRS